MHAAVVGKQQSREPKQADQPDVDITMTFINITSATTTTVSANATLATGTVCQSPSRVRLTTVAAFAAAQATYACTTPIRTTVGMMTWHRAHTAAMGHHRRPEEVASH
jgi:hypothetical protein